MTRLGLCASPRGRAGGDSADPPKAGRQTVTFQQGVNGYAGTVDLEIWAVAPNTCLEGNINASSDANNDGGESQVLMRFDDIIGTKPGQIPPRSTVHSATLVVSAFDQGTTVHLHRMLVPWKQTATWNSLVAGVTADGLEASRQKDSFTFGKIAASTSAIPFDVTDTVQAWVNGDGQPRLGVHQHRRQRLGLLHLRVRGRQAAAEAGRRVHAAAQVNSADRQPSRPLGGVTDDRSATRHLARRPGPLPRPTRRDLLRVGWLGGLGLTLGAVPEAARPPQAADPARSSSRRPSRSSTSTCRAASPTWTASTRSRTPRPSTAASSDPIETKLPGVRFSEHMAKTAEVADKLTVVRSMTHTEVDHSRGEHSMFTGYRPSPALTYPSLGSVTAHELGPRQRHAAVHRACPTAGSQFLGSGYLSNAVRPVRPRRRPRPARVQRPRPEPAEGRR